MISRCRSIALIAGLLFVLTAIAPLGAQSKSKVGTRNPKGPTSGRKAAKAEAEQPPADEFNVPASELPEKDFGIDAALPSAVMEAAPDETLDGRAQLRDLEARAREKISEIDRIRKEIAKPHREYLVLVGADQQRYEEIAIAQSDIVALASERAALEEEYSFARTEVKQRIANAINNVDGQIGSRKQVISNAQSAIRANAPHLRALYTQLKPQFARITQHTNEMFEARQQWIKLRQPFERYLLGDYVKLRDVLDQWLLIDGGWLYAQIWGALCATELNDPVAARGYAEKAVTIFEESYSTQNNKVESAILQATLGLVSYGEQPQQKTFARKSLEAASRLSDKVKKNDAGAVFVTYFIIGRAYAAREADFTKALQNLNKSLKISPEFPSARLWQARIQTVSTREHQRNLPDGISTLEELWESTNHRSWRIASFLADAYLIDEQSEKAEALKQAALQLAPRQCQESVSDSFAAAEGIAEKIAAMPAKK